MLFALEEPEPGFAPTLMGAMGLFAVAGAGIIKTIHMGLNTCLDLTPLDLGIKSLCFYTMQAVSLYEKPKKRPNEVPVYHTSSYSHSNFTFPQYIEMVQDYGFWKDGAFQKNLLLPHIHCTENRFVYLFLVNIMSISVVNLVI